MSSPKRIAKGDIVYHELNRANGRLRIFKKRQNFAAFESILAEGIERYRMRLCGYCIMGTHWHLVLWPRRFEPLHAVDHGDPHSALGRR
jgi:putative transposase